MWHNTPLIEAKDVPKRRPECRTHEAYNRLVGDYATQMAGRPCMCTKRSYWIWNDRSEREITEAKKEGRWVVYERMRLLNPAPVKDD